VDDEADFQRRAVKQGQKARVLALEALRQCGFADIEEDVTYRDLGVDVTFRARDATHRVWLFDVSGAFSSTRPGLKRADTLWKALGKASVLSEARRREPGRGDLGPVILFSTDVPNRNSAGDRALRAVTSDGAGPVYDVIELWDPDGLARLQRYAESGPG
jgi:hypothetical protein